MGAITRSLVLEKTTEAFIEKLTSLGGPPLYQLEIPEARALLEKLQAGGSRVEGVHIEERAIKTGPTGSIALTIFRPEKRRSEKMGAIIYFHGGGWILGSVKTHERWCSALAAASDSAVVFVHYSPSPEKSFPIPLEEAYAAVAYIVEYASEFNFDPSHIAVSGDSAGGHMAIATTLLCKERNGPKLCCQLLFYPVTSCYLNTESYAEFSEGPWLTEAAMHWFWNAFAPDLATNRALKENPLLSPLQAPIDSLKELPPALVITAENDVLRDEGEAYAHQLMQAGVDTLATRYLGTIHDFCMLNALADTPAAKGALALAARFIKDHFGQKIGR